MKTKSTGIWFGLAVLLFTFIWFWQRHEAAVSSKSLVLLSGLRADAVTSIEVIPAGALAIEVDRTNGGWELEKPFVYPAQAAAIENLLTLLEKLTPSTRLSAGEIGANKNADKEYGFDNPEYSLVISAGEQQWQLRVGKKTAPGDQVFVRIVGVGGAFVTYADWLQYLPRDVAAWRDTALVMSASAFDMILITNGVKIIQLQRDATNRLWQMTRPLIARADNDRIMAALQQLRSAQISSFATDDPKADLAEYGLQPPNLELWLGSGTNLNGGIQLGKTLTEDPARAYARRAGWNSVFTVTNDVFTPWRGAVNDFRDPHLLELTAPVAEIDVRGDANIRLEQRGSNYWTVAGEKFPVDADSVRDFVRMLADLKVADFVKDNNTATDLEGFGLAAPAGTNRITLLSAAGDTNSIIAQIFFGTVETNLVYVKRADENYVYALGRDDFQQVKLYENGWVYRDRRVWDFSETNVAAITLRENGKTRTMLRNAVNLWSLAAGSQGIINPPALEETAHRLGELTTLGWVGRNSPVSEGGFNTNNLQIAVELKTGEKLILDFGAELPKANTALAAVILDGERWVFVFPPTTYQFVTTYLTIPPDAP